MRQIVLSILVENTPGVLSRNFWVYLQEEGIT